MADGKESEYIAHVRGGGGGGPPHDLADHLAAVAGLAGRFAASFGARDSAELGGCWHDLGKFRRGFQEYIRSRADEDFHLETRVTSRDKTHSAPN